MLKDRMAKRLFGQFSSPIPRSQMEFEQSAYHDSP